MFLNIIIVSIVSFYLIFGIVYRGLLEEKTPDLTEVSPWEQPFLIPKDWQLSHIEFASGNLLAWNGENWTLDGESNEVANLLASNWLGLVVQDISNYEQLPQGQTALVFVADQPEPIVYRMITDQESILIHRLNDKRLFKLPLEIKSVIWRG